MANSPSEDIFGVEGVYELGWIPPDDADIDKVATHDLPLVRKLARGFTWAEADILNWLADHPDEGASQYLDVEDYEEETRRRARRVAAHVPHAERRWSVWAHEEILRAPPEIRSTFVEWTEEAIESAPAPVREVARDAYQEGKPPPVRAIREASEAYEGKARPDALPRECPFCGAPEPSWKHAPPEDPQKGAA